MKIYFKSSLLLSAVLSASLFMIIESGEYYQKFYENSYQGYWAACLVESFLATAAILHFKSKKLLNTVIKIVMIPLFLVVVGGASLKVVTPMVNKLAQFESKNKLVNILVMENQQSMENIERLRGQRVNTAIEIKRQRETTNQLKETLKDNSTFGWMIWIVIGFSTFLRFAVQISNLVFAHSLGVMWREAKSDKNKPVRKKTDKKRATKSKRKKTSKKPVSPVSGLRTPRKNVVPLKSKSAIDLMPTKISESQMF